MYKLTQMAEYRMEAAGEKYRKGIVSLAEAATLARVSLYLMMEYVEREKIQAPALTEKEMQEELEKAETLFEKIKK